jgi:hypothetical protein
MEVKTMKTIAWEENVIEVKVQPSKKVQVEVQQSTEVKTMTKHNKG